MDSQKRKRLSLKEKIDIIEFSGKNKSSIRVIAERFKVGKTQVSDILKNSGELRKLYETSGNIQQKRKFPKTEGLAVDHIVYDWFCKVRNKHIPISGPIIKEKALEAAKELQLCDFKASNGWLEKFCQRHGITFKSICGQSANVNLEEVDDWQAKLQLILKDYAPRDIFNADETGLYYRALPTKTFALKNDKCCGGKSAKQRLTILFCANMIGEKEEPLVIGKNKNPRCFKGANIDKLPLEWSFNKKAWMTTDIMSAWLHQFNRKMQRQNRKVILFVDNATSHPHIELDHVKLVFLPPNTTSHCQPLDQGIIKNFKIIYRSFLVKRLLTLMNDKQSCEELEKNITIINALIWTVTAWKKLLPETISKCFSKAGFKFNDIPYQEFNEDDNIPLSQLFPNVCNSPCDLEEYALIDDNLSTENCELDIKNCVNEFYSQNQEQFDSSSEDEEREKVCSTISNLNDACEKLRDLENFFLLSNNISAVQKVSDILITVEDEILINKIKSKKQTTIIDHFGNKV